MKNNWFVGLMISIILTLFAGLIFVVIGQGIGLITTTFGLWTTVILLLVVLVVVEILVVLAAMLLAGLGYGVAFGIVVVKNFASSVVSRIKPKQRRK